MLNLPEPGHIYVPSDSDELLDGLLWADDGQIVHLTVSKVYSDKPGTVLTVEAAQ